MCAQVFFASAQTRSHGDSKIAKLARLCDAVGLKDTIHSGDLTAIKLHFGEYGNDTYLHPPFVRMVADKVRACGGNPFLTDTCTLYSGSRRNAVNHLRTAFEHGFDYGVVNAPVVIADGLHGGNDELVDIHLKHFEKVHIAREIRQASGMVVLSHFKGHEMAGFGGAVKNLAMGCASVAGKRDQHQTAVRVNEEACVGCGMCASVCPEGAAAMQDSGKAAIDQQRCIGCFECVTVCQSKAVDLDWSTDMPLFIERMTEYAYGAVQGKQDNICYFNFVLNVTPDCDCVGWSDMPLVPDIGILASRDPVALDQACFDLVSQAPSLHPDAADCGCAAHRHGQGADKFTARWEKTHGPLQLSYGESIGLGKREYTLVTV